MRMTVHMASGRFLLSVCGAATVTLLAFILFVYTSHGGQTASGLIGDLGPRFAVSRLFEMSQNDSRLQEMERVVRDLIKQRNNLSRKLNLKQQQVGQMECEKINNGTSLTGGWCSQQSREKSGHHLTDRPLAAELAEFLKAKTVGSFGDGPGRYKQLILDTGKVKGYDSYDGAPFSDTTSEGRVKFLDLTLQQFGLPLYDWVMSLEVAEHIPRQYESVYIDNIVRHAKEGVIISWAVPGQRGYFHINNRPHDYVIGMFDRLGFDYDKKASIELREKATSRWLKRNTSVFRRRAYTDDELYYT